MSRPHVARKPRNPLFGSRKTKTLNPCEWAKYRTCRFEVSTPKPGPHFVVSRIAVSNASAATTSSRRWAYRLSNTCAEISTTFSGLFGKILLRAVDHVHDVQAAHVIVQEKTMINKDGEIDKLPEGGVRFQLQIVQNQAGGTDTVIRIMVVVFSSRRVDVNHIAVIGQPVSG